MWSHLFVSRRWSCVLWKTRKRPALPRWEMQAAAQNEIVRWSLGLLLDFALLYTCFLPWKKGSFLHRTPFYLWKSAISVWRAGFSNPSHLSGSRGAARGCMWRLEKPTLHTLFWWKSAGNGRSVKGWTLFWGNKLRIGARAKSAREGGKG